MEKNAKQITNQLIGIAGVHFVVSELSLRGLIALPTIRNVRGIDVLVSELDGSGLAAVEVKASLGRHNFWLVSSPERCLRGRQNFYVFLRRGSGEKRFEAFLVPGDDVARQVEANLEDYRRRGCKEVPEWRLPKEEGERRALRESWETWRPPKI